jgi:hypothetical protein
VVVRRRCGPDRITLDFRPEISLFLFAAEPRGSYEILLMPWEGASVAADVMTRAAADVLFGVVGAVAGTLTRSSAALSTTAEASGSRARGVLSRAGQGSNLRPWD